MNIMHALLLFFVAILSAREVAANPELTTDSPGDRKTERSPNALLRGALSAEGVYEESDSHYGGGGEEGHFETGAPEFLEEARCIADGEVCVKGGGCCGKCKCVYRNFFGGKCLARQCYTAPTPPPTPKPTRAPTPAPVCQGEGDRCYSTDECCGHFSCDNGRTGRSGQCSCKEEGDFCGSTGECCNDMSCVHGQCEEGECKEERDRCDSTDECCNDMSCVHGQCEEGECKEEGDFCGSTGECCNDMSCVHGQCKVCKESGEECSDDDDCCSESCERRHEDDPKECL